MSKNNIEFEILINDLFGKINTDGTLSPIDKKHVLSLINDFEEGKWRLKKFQDFIWDNIAETALSAKERESLVNKSHSILSAAAQNLRLTDKADDISKGSELAEIVLYGIMKNHYNALPVVPKIFYKQNVHDNAKGADSVHIVLEDGEEFSLWFGEAKFYNNIEDPRLGTIIESIENSLQAEKLKKENSIITNVSDLENLGLNDAVKQKIYSVLSGKTSIDEVKPKLHIPILLLHECDITKACTDLSDQYKQDIIDFHKARSIAYFTKQIKKLGLTLHKYSEITFHIILFPVPCKKDIIEKFVSKVEHFKN